VRGVSLRGGHVRPLVLCDEDCTDESPPALVLNVPNCNETQHLGRWIMLTVKEASDRAKVSRSLVYLWIKERLFPVYRRGGLGRRGKILIDEPGFLAFLEAQKVAPGPELTLVHIKLR